MRVLWLTRYPPTGFVDKFASAYHGEGWVFSLQNAVEKQNADIDLGVAFLFPNTESKKHDGKVTYYPIRKEQKSSIQKALFYLGGYKREGKTYLLETLDVINDFKPDLIHIFGIESPFAFMVGYTDIPVVIHLQGILNPCHNSFYPQGMNQYTFLFKDFFIKEWLLHNGYNFSYDEMKVRSQREVSLFKNAKYFMGRTEWDFQISRIFSPNSEYFHVNEILRDSFYEEIPWIIQKSGKFIIMSTISETVYKGLDTILKTAQLLKQFTGLDFEWKVVGVNGDSKFVQFFEKDLQIKGKEVNVAYKGVWNAGQICAGLQQTHVYVHPSYIDNSPNSLCEAQMIGLPVIGTYVGGIPSLITHNETGLLVPANTPHELAYQLQYLQQHPETMVQLGKNARETAIHRHSKEKIVSDLISVYHHISKTKH